MMTVCAQCYELSFEEFTCLDKIFVLLDTVPKTGECCNSTRTCNQVFLAPAPTVPEFS